jgi:hypothetical protein
MLDVETNHQIILLYFKEGLSQRKIARHLKISRKTVKARVVEYERFKSQSASGDPDAIAATNKYLTQGPAYDSSKRTKRRLTQEIADIIEACLHENEIKRLDGRKKQQLRKTDIHEKLLSAGYCIGYTTVSEYIRTRSGQAREAFIKQGYGEGSVSVSLIGQKLKSCWTVSTVVITWPSLPALTAITATLCSSNARTAWPIRKRISAFSSMLAGYTIRWSMTICAWPLLNL